MAGKRGQSVANKLSELLDAIKDCREETNEKSNTQLPVDQQLRNLFPSIGQPNRYESNKSGNSSSCSSSCQSTSQSQSVNDSFKPESRARGIENFLQKRKLAPSSRVAKRKKVKSTSTVACILKDIFFLTSKTDEVQYEYNTCLVHSQRRCGRGTCPLPLNFKFVKFVKIY